MGLEKAIIYGKEHRKPYRGSKSVDRSCRNHGRHNHGPGNQCIWCLDNRLHSYRVRKLAAKAKAEIIEDNDFCEGCYVADCLTCPFNFDKSRTRES